MNAQSRVHVGPELGEVPQENVEFLAVAADTKVRLFPDPWPADQLPQPTSSLMSIANQNGLIAAASPKELVIASIDAVRNAFSADAVSENSVKPFMAQLLIPTPRLSQVAFSSDESCLVLCAAQGGGLQIYDTTKLKQGSTEAAFSISTNGSPIRSILPNPALDSAHLMAIVLDNGNFVLADLKARNLVNGRNGSVLQEGVSCASWSSKGKQIMLGLVNGSAIQMAPDGTPKAQMPKAPQMHADVHVSSLMWLANDSFLVYYTPTQFESGTNPDSYPMLVTREPKSQNYTYSQFPTDPSDPFGMSRSPPHHFMTRIRDWKPHLQDLIIVSSTASDAIGMFAKSSNPLSSDPSVAAFAGNYAIITPSNDSRRAGMPSNENMDPTSPIGLCLDLSVTKPVLAAASKESDIQPPPLPALFALNHEGVLCAWWVVYHESVRQEITYAGMLVASSEQQSSTPSAKVSSSSTSTPFGGSSIAASQPAFGRTSTPGFGTPGSLGTQGSPWAAAGSNLTQSSSAFGKPAFGQPSTFGSATPLGSGFGQTGSLGQSASPWGAAAASSGGSTNNRPFASQTTSDMPSSSPFGGLGSTNPSGSSFFSSNSKPSSFGNLASNQTTSIFGKSKPGLTQETSKASTITLSSNSGSMLEAPNSSFGVQSLSGSSTNANKDGDDDMMDDASTPQPVEGDKPPAADKTANQNNAESSFAGFKLSGDNSTKQENKPPKNDSDGDNMLGSSFTNALNSISTTNTANTAKPAESLFGNVKKSSAISGSTNLFGNTEKTNDGSRPSTALSKPAPKVKKEPEDDIANADEGDPPLPPDPTPAQRKAAAAPVHNLFGSISKISKEQASDSSTSLTADLTSKTEASSTKQEAKQDQTNNTAAEATAMPESPPESRQHSRAGSSPVEIESADLAGFKKPATLERPSEPQATTSPKILSFSGVSGFPNRNFTAPAANAGSGLTEPPIKFPLPQKSNNSGPLPERSPSPMRSQRPPSDSGTVRRSSQSPTRRLFSSQRTPSPSRRLLTESATPVATPPSAPSLFEVPAQGQKTYGAHVGSRLKAIDSPRTRPDHGQEDKSKQQEATRVNDEISRRQNELSQPIQPCADLAPFLSTVDYTGHLKAGHDIARTVERMYYDMCSMVDTLGLNARSMTAFVSWHSQQADRERNADDLDKERRKDWHIGEIEDLVIIQKELAEHLESNRIEGVRDKIDACIAIHKQALRLRKSNAEIRQLVQIKTDPETVVQARSAVLSAEQSTIMKDLGAQYAEVAKLLTTAEDHASMLRAKISAMQGPESRSNGTHQVPTLEAVLNTIQKMTRMAEKKSGDVDMLEAQMRQVRFKANSGITDDLGMSTLSLNGNGSPYRSSPFKRSLGSTMRSSGTYSANNLADEDDSEDETLGVSLRSSTRSRKAITGGFGNSLRDDKKQIAREAIKAALRNKVEARGAPAVRDVRAMTAAAAVR